MPAGRPPAGPKIVEKYEGSRTAKQRLKATLETIAGQTTVDSACGKLGICPARFYVLRDRILESALQGAEPRAGGRPRKLVSPEQARVQELEQQVARLEYELTVATVRAETALLLPGKSSSHDLVAAQKKTPRQRTPRKKCRSARSRR